MKNNNNLIINQLKRNLSLKNNFTIENQFYYQSHKSRLDKVLNHYELMKKIKNISGDIVELGVFKGISLIRLAQLRDTLRLKKRIYGFDTFDSFPKSKKKDNYDQNFPNLFKKIIGKPIAKTELIKILKIKKLKNIKLIKGNIFQTINYCIKKKIKISLLHLDLDLEEITSLSLKILYNNVVKGGIIIFDDYGIHPGIKKAVKKNIKKKILPPIYGKNPYYFIKD